MSQSAPQLPQNDEFAEKLEKLDTLAAILPALAGQDRSQQLAHLLTDDDIDTLRHLAKEGMGENTLRALTSDFSYLEAWCQAATGTPLPWPAPESLILKFLAHHLWDLEKRKIDPAHGMPETVAAELEDLKILRTQKNTAGLRPPHAPATVERRLATWSTLHRWRGLDGAFSSPQIRSAKRLAVRTADRPKTRKSKKAVTADILKRLLATCEGTDYQRPSLTDLRDQALLLLGFASGGRRRSEIAGLRMDRIQFEDPVPSDPDRPDSPLLPCATIRLGRTKTEDSSTDDNHVLLLGQPVDALQAWLKASGIMDGPVFRAIDQWGNLKTRPLSPQSINAILKKRCAAAGLDPKDFSAHGLRSGFLTEAANQGIALQDAMQQSRHRSLSQASAYYNEANRQRLRSARILE
ncbi:site-specific integrase [uncultured Roseibium sp.]|uniref:site-specific integrase n=1 Tax=uncultured Roseibium sp. TaxID=1936171 RepID=UPI002602C695|nr:site-specific integrase [uncultured Roseibium sp.]